MRRRIKRALLPVAVCASGLALAAPAAHAANLQTCEGSSITGSGSSFQNVVQQQAWTPNDLSTAGFAGSNASSSFCLPGTPFNVSNNTIAYSSIGSGAGKRRFDSDGVAPYRAGNGSDRFIAFDQAPTRAEIANVDAGDPSTSTDDAHVRVIPVALGAITISVHFPDGCKWRSDWDWRANGTDFTTRFKVPNFKWEQVFDGTITTWGDLLRISPSIAGVSAIPGSGKTNADCVAAPITRVVRSDVSGTTFNLKQWLWTVDAAQSPSWDETAVGGLANLDWPNDAGATRAVRASGNGGVATAIAATNGSVGYVDLATARQSGFDMTPAASLLTADRTFWVPVDNGAGISTDPQKQELAFKSTSTDRGANCSTANVVNKPSGPDLTLDADWSRVRALNSPAGYGLCLVTFMGAFDDDRDAFGFGGGAEQGRARTVKDYLTYVTSTAGQLLLPSYDYAKLPIGLITTARDGANAIGWNKSLEIGMTGTPDWLPMLSAGIDAVYARVVRLDEARMTTTPDKDAAIATARAEGARPEILYSDRLTSPATIRADALRYGPMATSTLPLLYVELGNEDSYSYKGATASTARTYGDQVEAVANALAGTGVKIIVQADDAGINGTTNWVANMYSTFPDMDSHPAVGGWVIHPYGTDYLTRINRLISQTTAQGAPADFPIFVTEFGLSTDDGNCLSDNYGWDRCMTYARAGTTMTSVVNDVRANARAVKGWYVYHEIDATTHGASTDREAYFGVMKRDGTSKPGYTDVVAHLADGGS